MRVRVSPPAQIHFHLNLDEFISGKIKNEVDELSFSWDSPSNIALVKYWGKFPNQTPKNPSISFTLSNCKTTTNVLFKRLPKSNDLVAFDFYFENKLNIDFRPKIEKFFSSITKYCPYLLDFHLTIRSSNSFPHSSGIASSASGMSALSLCIMSLEKELTEIDMNYMFQKASFISRIGSGSACRSIYGGINFWGNHQETSKSSDFYSFKMDEHISSKFDNYRDTILIIDNQAKEVSSSVGHKLMDNHPFSEIRFEQANQNISKLKSILSIGDLNKFCDLVEKEALMLHSLMMSSDPSYILMKPETLIVITKIQKFRKKFKIPVCFTLDAGANVHVLFPDNYSVQVEDFIKDELLSYCENKKFISDIVGDGPKQI